MRLYGDLRRPTATAFAVRSFIVAIRLFCGRSTDRIVAVQSQYTRATVDRVQTEYSSSATMDDRTATTVRAVRAQTDGRPIALRSKSRRKEFWTVQNFSATVWRPVRPTTTALRSYWDLTAICRDLIPKLVAVRLRPRCDWGITHNIIRGARCRRRKGSLCMREDTPCRPRFDASPARLVSAWVILAATVDLTHLSR